MQDLQEVTHEIHYENYRSEKLQPRKQRINDIDVDEQQKKLIKEKDDEVNMIVHELFPLNESLFILLKLRRMQDMLAKMQGQLAEKQQLVTP